VAVSTIPALKDALYDAIVIDANVVAAAIQVAYGAPLPNPSRELIWLADVDGEQATAALGHQRREETYTLTIFVDILREGLDQKACTERAFTVAGWIENILRTDASVGAVVRTAVVAGPLRLEEFASDTSRGARLTLSVYCTARI
jgi:hypothetical protein